jgi:hypothetical protein
MWAWLGVFDDLGIENLADHLLPSLLLTHVFELLLECHFKFLERELVSL